MTFSAALCQGRCYERRLSEKKAGEFDDADVCVYADMDVFPVIPSGTKPTSTYETGRTIARASKHRDRSFNFLRRAFLSFFVSYPLSQPASHIFSN